MQDSHYQKVTHIDKLEKDEQVSGCTNAKCRAWMGGSSKAVTPAAAWPLAASQTSRSPGRIA